MPEIVYITSFVRYSETNQTYTLIRTLFTVVDQEMSYKLFYLSTNGSDISSCGKTYETACKTFEHVLSLYYDVPHQRKLGLEIITSKSFTIDQDIMVSNTESSLINQTPYSSHKCKDASRFPSTNDRIMQYLHYMCIFVHRFPFRGFEVPFSEYHLIQRSKPCKRIILLQMFILMGLTS